MCGIKSLRFDEHLHGGCILSWMPQCCPLLAGIADLLARPAEACACRGPPGVFWGRIHSAGEQRSRSLPWGAARLRRELSGALSGYSQPPPPPHPPAQFPRSELSNWPKASAGLCPSPPSARQNSAGAKGTWGWRIRRAPQRHPRLSPPKATRTPCAVCRLKLYALERGRGSCSALAGGGAC